MRCTTTANITLTSNTISGLSTTGGGSPTGIGLGGGISQSGVLTATATQNVVSGLSTSFAGLNANAIGIGGGYVVSVLLFGANPVTYLDNTFQYMDLDDLSSGLIKAAVFGMLVAAVGCMQGFYTTGGAEGVGRSTTRAVVVASIAILISDFFLTKLLF